MFWLFIIHTFSKFNPLSIETHMSGGGGRDATALECAYVIAG